MAKTETATGWKGITRYQWLVLLICWLGWVFDIFDTALFNFAKGPMLTEMLGGPEAYKELGPQTEGTIMMVFLVGWALGGLIFGILADRWGRTRTLIVTILIYSLFTGLTAYCTSIEQVTIVRFITALGLGGEWAAGAALVAEVFASGNRPLAAGLLQTAAAFGPALAAVANLQVPTGEWRTLFLIGVAPAILVVLIRLVVKEPVKWSKSREQYKGSWSAPLRELFGVGRWRRAVIVATIIGAVGIAGAGNASFWHPNLVEAASKGLSPEVIQQRKSEALFIFHIGTLLGVLVVPWLCALISRRAAMLAFFIGAPLSIFAYTTLGGSYEALLWLGPVMAFFAIGVSGAFVLYFPELFPTRLRATGAGFAYNVGRVLASPFPWLTGMLIGGMSGQVLYGFAGAALIYVIGIVALPFAPETKGQPLPEDDGPKPTRSWSAPRK